MYNERVIKIIEELRSYLITYSEIQLKIEYYAKQSKMIEDIINIEDLSEEQKQNRISLYNIKDKYKEVSKMEHNAISYFEIRILVILEELKDLDKKIFDKYIKLFEKIVDENIAEQFN